MLKPRQFAEHIGFTEQEVKSLCEKYGADYNECLRWYDGYKMNDKISICNPLSIVTAIQDGEFDSFWSATGSFEALQDYILMDFNGIRQDVINMISGASVPVNVTKFKNTLDSITNKDNAFTYLIHLGYLCYNSKDKTCHIPNEEVRREWINSIEDEEDYTKVMAVVNASKRLLDDTINGDEEAVAKALDASHTEVTSHWTYNNEHSLHSAIYLAYFYANTKYTVIKELATGKGFADMALIPYVPNVPAMVIELKHNNTTETAIQQIKDKVYDERLHHNRGNLLFVGINYEEKTKTHTCKIERLEV